MFVLALPKKMRTIIKIILILIALLSAILIYGVDKSAIHQKSLSSLKDNIFFKRLSIEDGLSQSWITCITQDFRGFMWFGTGNGLNRFDGNKINIYRHDLNDLHSLSDNLVNFCLLDKKGVLWFITGDNVLNKYDPNIDGFIRIKILSKNNKENKINIRLFLDDADGKLWFGTFRNGLISYDPETGLQNSYIDQLDPSGETHGKPKSVRTIYFTKDKSMWIGTNIGLVSFDKSRQKFLPYPYSWSNSDQSLKKEILHSPIISQIHEAGNGTLWVGTYYGGLFKLDPVKNLLVNYPFNKNLPDRFPGNSIPLIHEDNSGMLWLPCRQYKRDFTFERRCLTKLDPITGLFTLYTHNSKNPGSIFQDTVRRIWTDSYQQQWFHTFGGGLDVYEHNFDSFTHFSYNPKNNKSLSGNDISCFYEDRSGTIWIGTQSNGISFFDPGWKKFPHYLIDHPAQYRDSNQMVIKIHGSNSELDESGEHNVIWFSTFAGLNRWDRRDNSFAFFEVTPKTPDLRVGGMCEDRLGNLWLGTAGGLFRAKLADFKNKNKKPDFINVIPRVSPGVGIISEIIADSSGNLWMSFYSVGLGKFNPKTEKIIYYKNNPKNSNSLMDNGITQIFHGRNDRIWITTQSGLDLFDPKKEIFTHLYPNDAGFDTENIICLHEEPNNILWVGTNNMGMVKYNIVSKKVVRYLEKDGLPNNVVNAILPQSSKNGKTQYFWISTENGISRFDVQLETFDNFFRKDGLQSNEFNGRAAFLSPNGEMFFGGVNGFNNFFPNKILKSTYISPVFITDFQLFNQSVRPGANSVLKKPVEAADSINITYEDRVITFEFTSLHFSDPGTVNYAYFLEGFDKDWSYCKNRRFATYTNLPSGNYIFRVKATNCDGLWNEKGTSIMLTVSPPLWETWWFRLMLLLFMIVLFYFWYKHRIKRMIKKAKEEASLDSFCTRMKLTSQEKNVLLLVLNGKSNNEIAEELYISLGTVKNYISNIYKKNGVKTRAQLFYLFKENNL